MGRIGFEFYTQGDNGMKRLILLFIAIVFLSSGIAYSEERGVAVRKIGGSETASVSGTKYHALIIGNNDYKYQPKLKTPISDARSVEKILKEMYGFNTRLLMNATRKEILGSMNELRKGLGENDSLLIYYAGHGEFDNSAAVTSHIILPKSFTLN
ncbi:MAG: caspase family protein [Nitrospirae bacterium]|nr:caspase family protein [Nitrospirota bacterium]